MKVLLSPGGRELGLECENSTINLITRVVAPAPVSSTFYRGSKYLLVGLCAPFAHPSLLGEVFIGGGST